PIARFAVNLDPLPPRFAPPLVRHLFATSPAIFRSAPQTGCKPRPATLACPLLDRLGSAHPLLSRSPEPLPLRFALLNPFPDPHLPLGRAVRTSVPTIPLIVLLRLKNLPAPLACPNPALFAHPPFPFRRQFQFPPHFRLFHPT